MFCSSISYLTDLLFATTFWSDYPLLRWIFQWSCYRRRTLGTTVLFCDGHSGLSSLRDRFRHGALLMVSHCLHTSLILLPNPITPITQSPALFTL
ncbi:hypothetical protein BU16DRAFT_360955 [Lophium mytilinum]|uniref:Uncharacterized protein n=1 Tax=Lophium mytilinum TaxID=390894 RepID=A0A6A6QUQ1_9PEZI|nr:hypothetical protein BU16DRAFT_360955 [Lophium mytilinum]